MSVLKVDNYYSGQLEKLTEGKYCKSVVLRDGEGGKTNNMSLNEESIPVLIEFLKLELEKLEKEGKGD